MLFTFPSRYLFTIGRRIVFSLGRWSSQIPAGFHVPCGTREHFQELVQFRVGGCHPLWPAFPDRSATTPVCNSIAAQGTARNVPQLRTSNGPSLTLMRFRLFPVRSPLLGESRLISFPSPTEMFQFREFPTLRSTGCPVRLPDSETYGSMPVSDSP